MKRIFINVTSICFLFIFFCCSTDSPVTKNEDPPNNEYVKVVTAENSGLKFEIWSSTANSLRFGYNKIGFKVFENSQPKSSGFVKFFPKMYNSGGSFVRSTPVKAQYDYDNSFQMFTGYVIFTKETGSTGSWYGFYSYNNLLNLDSIVFNVSVFASGQILTFLDSYSGANYYITLLKPYSPQQGLNTLQCMLHKSNDNTNFQQVNDAQILIMPWMENMGHGSTNNVHPQHIGGGVYEGTVNFNMPGQWSVYDTVYHENRKVTPDLPPKFTFNP